MAKEDFELKGSSFVSVFCILSMHLFIDSPNCVSVSHLYLSKILIFGVKSFLKIRDSFFPLLEFFYLLK
jgi:hypothetical protein